MPLLRPSPTTEAAEATALHRRDYSNQMACMWSEISSELPGRSVASSARFQQLLRCGGLLLLRAAAVHVRPYINIL